VEHQKIFQIDNGLIIRTGLDKHRYYTLCLEITQRFKIRDNDHPQKHIDFAKDNLARIATAENDLENGNEAEDEDEEGE
jgi:hypothetical protein